MALSPQDTVDIIVRLAILVVAAAVIGIVGVLVYRRVTRTEQESAEPAFTLSDLRRLHRQGHLDDEEFKRAKTLLIAGLASDLLQDADQDDADDDANLNDEADTSDDAHA